jgi:hypothetical protein
LSKCCWPSGSNVIWSIYGLFQNRAPPFGSTVSGLAVAPNETALEGAWLEADSKWINAPKDVAPHGGFNAIVFSVADFVQDAESLQNFRVSGY